MREAEQNGTAFVPVPAGVDLNNVFCEMHERVVGKNNCVKFNNLTLQLPADQHRFNYVKVKLAVRLYLDDSIALFHGSRLLAKYDFETVLQLQQKADFSIC